MEIKVIREKKNHYIINGWRTVAESVSEALNEYLAIHDGGARTISGTNLSHMQ